MDESIIIDYNRSRSKLPVCFSEFFSAFRVLGPAPPSLIAGEAPAQTAACAFQPFASFPRRASAGRRPERHGKTGPAPDRAGCAPWTKRSFHAAARPGSRQPRAAHTPLDPNPYPPARIKKALPQPWPKKRARALPIRRRAPVCPALGARQPFSSETGSTRPTCFPLERMVSAYHRAESLGMRRRVW